MPNKNVDPIARLLQHTLSVPDDDTVAPDYAVGRIASRDMEIGVWRLRLREADIIFSRQARAILGLDSGAESVPLPAFLQRFTKIGRTKAAEVIQAALIERRGFQVEAEVVDFQNHVRYLEYFGDVEFDGIGDLTGLVGTVRDVSPYRRAEQLAATRLLLLRALLKNLPLAIAMLDRDMRYVAVSDYWVAGHNLGSAADVLGKCHYDLFDLPEEVKREHRQVMAGVRLERPRAYLKDGKGRTITQNAILAPWYKSQGEVGGMMIILADVDRDNLPPPDLAIGDRPLKGEFDALLRQFDVN